ncbi:MAG: UDP-N-acetylmuramate dehydrogenase [Coriobacteriales bacterium]|jgi:UDP-N-acetylmuramate dehydrogenase|nr:UDP-N-acetylmuramate dehydrogenase [Coriobacteriales bacterium]
MAILDAYSELRGSLDGNVYLDEPMNRRTSYQIGGPVSLFVECASVHDLQVCLTVAAAEQMPWAVIGRGSNLLVHDQGWRGMVLTLTGQFKEIVLGEVDGATVPLVAGSGVILANLVQTAFKNGFSGFEFAVGIPGTLGGALVMNAGTSTEGIGAIVASLTVYRPEVGLLRVQGYELPWEYRCSGITPGDIIVEAELLAKPSNVAQIQGRMEALLGRRKATQPLNKPSAGSVFRNPPGDSAGAIIEGLGFKGYRVGGAEVSSKHANFIVNNGSATAADVLAIIREIRHRVKEEYGTELQTEVQFIGFEETKTTN